MKLAAQQWNALRLQWEVMGFSDREVAKRFGTSYTSVQRRRDADAKQGSPWVRRGSSPATIEKALFKADTAALLKGNTGIERSTDTGKCVTDKPSFSEAASTALAVDIRAVVIKGMREDWDELRPTRKAALRILQTALVMVEGGEDLPDMPASDDDKAGVLKDSKRKERDEPNRFIVALQIAKLAQECVRISAQTLKDEQDTMAKAWGLDGYSENPNGDGMPDFAELDAIYAKVRRASRVAAIERGPDLPLEP